MVMAESTGRPAPQDTRAAALAYVLGFITGLFCLWFYPDRPFVRFHAWQSLLLWIAVGLAILGVDFIPIVGKGLVLILVVMALALTVLLLWHAWRGNWWMLPLIGDIARERAEGR
jgi:uncharacterized membrane protein